MTTKITDKNISQLANAGVDWQAVFTGDGSTGLTAVAGRGYFIDTTSGTVTVTLPASPSAGDVVVLKDYARTWATNNVTTASALFDGITTSSTFSTEGQTVTLVYMDGTKGWSLINEDTTTSLGAKFIAATGGTITTSGDFKIHTFTGDGCFVVSCAGNPGGSTSVDYLVVAGGGGSANDVSGGGGAGGFRESHSTPVSGCYTASPLATPTGITVSASTYPVTVGAGGAGQNNGCAVSGSNSIFSTITSTGGGYAGSPFPNAGGPGGSGGGGYRGCNAGGTGNTPPVSPPQGNNGGSGHNPCAGGAGGGGGASENGAGGTADNVPGSGGGGNGVATLINPATGQPSGCTQYYSGGGGGGTRSAVYNSTPGGPGGLGGGGAGSGGSGNPACTPGTSGTSNTGGGGGGATNGSGTGGSGGKGIVIIRYKYQ